MSNALCLASFGEPPGAALRTALAALEHSATTPATQPAEPISTTLLIFAVLGAMLLAAWLAANFRHPRRLRLSLAPGRKNSVNPLHVLAVLLAWAATWALLRQALAGPFGVNLSPPPGPPQPLMKLTLLVSVAVSAIMAGGSLAMGMLTFRLGLRSGMGLNLRHWICDALRAVLAYLMVLPAVLGLLKIAEHILRNWPDLIRPHDILVALVSLGFGWKLLAFLSACVLAPLAEELFFRGLVQSMLRRYFGSPWPAILVTSVLFAAMHKDYPQTVPSMAALAVALGYLYERSGRLVSPILAHALFNTVSMVGTLAGQG